MRFHPLSALAAICAAAVAAGCGGSAGDILALEVSTGRDAESARLTVTEDGRGACDGGALEPIASERLIEAREVAREIEGLAEEGARFGLSAARDGRTYTAHTPAGTVRWVEGASELPEPLPRAAVLARELEDDLCS